MGAVVGRDGTRSRQRQPLDRSSVHLRRADLATRADQGAALSRAFHDD
jgi:hypothetical protein